MVPGETFVDVWWKSPTKYDAWFLNYTLRGPNGPQSIPHGDDGDWGYQRIDGLLPGRTYDVQVQGCLEVLFGILDDACHEWSESKPVTTLEYPLHSGPDTCAPGFVWREAFPDDHVCVSPQRRDAVKADNAKAWERREFVCTPEMLKAQSCPFAPPDTCKQFRDDLLIGVRFPTGWVYREARPEDHVCVTKEEHDLIQHENATANERRARPEEPTVPCPLCGLVPRGDAGKITPTPSP
jgi:hypothetical protein